MRSILKSIQLIRNMGLRYITFRVSFELRKRIGAIKKKFPQNPPSECFISIDQWRQKKLFFGVQHKDEAARGSLKVPDIEQILSGKLQFFSASWIDLGRDYDWTTNPETHHRYDPGQHWSDVQDYNSAAGDIKLVWEKSRFAYLYEIIRHDHLKKEDHSEWVFNEIKSWLIVNKINSGPNYKCSQEISLRVLNWTYALNYYKDSKYLTSELFQNILHAIYWQLKHVYSNINFSRIAVRNNHALTETLTLYLGSLYYPFFPEASVWKRDGKMWFEEEIAYQIYEDGTFLQFSMNYHRVVIQLLTWALRSSEFFNEKFSDVVYEKAYKSLKFLLACQDEFTGWLPNYGSNDGALFFKFNSCDFRDYKPQLNALHVLLTGEKLYSDGEWNEDLFWLNINKIKGSDYPALTFRTGWSQFTDGGYYILRENETLTFIRCGKHKDRPAQADNLHLDIWYKGENIIFDGGSYKYNTDGGNLKYFMGTESHNTVMLDKEDQMLKGLRFVWFNWSQAIGASVMESDSEYFFEGEISAFRYINSKIRHKRKVIKLKGKPNWVVEDSIIHKPKNLIVNQLWHVLPQVKLISEDQAGSSLVHKKEDGWRSDYYGVKTSADQYVAQTVKDKIITIIQCQ